LHQEHKINLEFRYLIRILRCSDETLQCSEPIKALVAALIEICQIVPWIAGQLTLSIPASWFET
jgi:hypothetical protein